MKRGLMVMVCLVFFVSFVSATNYYVSPAGSASWASCTNINTPCSLSTANTNAVAEDVVYFRTGTYTTSLNPAHSGVSGNPITFAAYNGENAYLENGNYAIDLRNGQDYLIIDGFKSDNAKQYELFAQNSTHVELKNCHFSVNMPGATAWFSVDIDAGCSYWSIHNNKFDVIQRPTGLLNESGGSLLGIGGSANPAHHNYIYNNIFIDGMNHDFFALSYSDYNVVENNTFYNTGTWVCTSDPGTCAVGPGETMQIEKGADHNVIENNVYHETSRNFGDSHMVGIHQLNSKYNIYRGNIGYDYDGWGIDIYTGPNYGYADTDYNRIYSNTYYNMMSSTYYSNDGHGVIRLYDYQSNQYLKHTKVVNNVVSTSGKRAFEANEIYSGMLLPYSNEFFGNWLYYIAQSTEVRRYTPNDSTQYYTISQAQTNFPSEFHDNSPNDLIDPKLTNPASGDMRLQSSSPCIDAGQWLTTITSATGSGTSFVVADPYFFFDGYGISGVSGDTIKTQNGQKTTIQSINYNTKTITVSPAINIVNGEGLSLDYSGSKPDIGAIEYTATGTCNENWQCTSWSAWSLCVNNLQTRTRTCTDLKSCGTTTNKPSESETQSCSPSAKSYTILKTQNPITVDGNLNEFANTNPITITNSNGNSLIYKMLWDSNNLYIAAQGSDSQLAAVLNTRDGSVWNDDAIELFFDTLNNGGTTLQSDDYKFFVNLLNVQRDNSVGDGGVSWNTVFTSAVTTTGTLNVAGDTDTGYTIEAAIPWAGWVTPSDNSVWGFDVSMDDRNDAGSTIQKTRSQTNVGNIPDEFGDVVFSSQYVVSGSECNSDADSDGDSNISIGELINYISRWKSRNVSILKLVEAIDNWKNGC